MFNASSLVQHPRPGTDFYIPGTVDTQPVQGKTAGLFGVDFNNEKNYYYLSLVVFAVMAAIVLVVRRIRLGVLLRAMADSPVALEAHGANTQAMRIAVFCLSAFMAGVGGGVLAGVTQSASGVPGGTFDYTSSLILVAVLGFCGRRSILSPLLAAFAFQVVKIYPPFDDPTMIKYRGVMFGALAILIAIWPALNLGGLLGRRARERQDPEAGSRLQDRLDVASARPMVQPHDRAPVLTGAGGTRS
jgi:ABC-type branched-subunit amino acid transport system permease subunit